MQPPRGFRLVPDASLSARAHVPIELERGPVHLSLSDGEPRVRTELPVVLESGVVLEPVRSDLDARVAMVSPRGSNVRVNGAPPPRIALLQVGDEVQIDGRLHLHVTVYHRPEIRPAGETHGGAECPVCRVTLEPDVQVYVCPRCGDATHCEFDDESSPGLEAGHAGRDALPCARLTSACARCGTPVILDEGYAYVPDV